MNGHILVGSVPIPIYSSDPYPGTDGLLIINSTDNEFKVFYNGVWNVVGITITPGEAVTPVTGNPIGLLLALTYTVE